MKTKTAPFLLAAILVGATLVAVAGTAPAQSTQAPSTTTIKITPYQDPIKPLSGFAVLKGTVTYTYMSAGSTALVATKVGLKVAEQPAWAVVTISPSTLLFPIQQSTTPGTTVTAPPQDVSIIVTTTADAPAFTAANIRITAVAEPNQPIGGSNGEDATLIQADYFSIIDAQVDSPIRVVRPQSAVNFPVTIQNFGNANTKINFEVLGQDEKQGARKDALQVPVPQPVTLEARQTGGKTTKQTVPLAIQTPFKNGYMNQPEVVNVRLKAAYALDPSKKGEEVTLSILATTKGFYVPGPDAFLALAGVGLAAALVGLRRRPESR